MARETDPETRRMIDAKLAELGERVRCPPDKRLDSARLPGQRESRALMQSGKGRAPDPAVQARVVEVGRRLAAGEDRQAMRAALGLTPPQMAYAERLARQRDPGLPRPARRGERAAQRVAERRAEVRRLLLERHTRADIARALGVSAMTIGLDVKALLEAEPDLAARIPRRGRRRKTRQAGAPVDRPAKPVCGARNGRRFTDAVVPSGEAEKVLPPEHPAIAEKRPLFPERVVAAGDAARVLKSGKHNRKIGERVLVGRLRGAPIYTLSLPERATCPPCPLERACYGNNLQWTERIAPGPELEIALLDEVCALAEIHPAFLVRLHIVGDFYAPGYLRHWARLLRDFPGLNVFGFTAWPPESEIGAEIGALRARFTPRFEIRFSDRTGPWGTFTIDWPTRLKRLGDAVVCPEMRDSYMAPERLTHCGSCGLCWTGQPTPIAFILH